MDSELKLEIKKGKLHEKKLKMLNYNNLGVCVYLCVSYMTYTSFSKGLSSSWSAGIPAGSLPHLRPGPLRRSSPAEEKTTIGSTILMELEQFMTFKPSFNSGIYIRMVTSGFHICGWFVLCLSESKHVCYEWNSMGNLLQLTWAAWEKLTTAPTLDKEV